MAEELIGLLSGGGITSSIVNGLEQFGMNLLRWFKQAIFFIWQTAQRFVYRLLQYAVEHPIGFITLIGELAVWLS